MQENARTQVLNQARLMMQAARSVRDYTTLQLKPLLAPQEARDNTFLPQTVPACGHGEFQLPSRQLSRLHLQGGFSQSHQSPRPRRGLGG
jgi:hypothetical protein